MAFLLTLVAAVAIAATGCTNKATGQAVPTTGASNTPQSTANTESSAPTSSGGGSGQSLDSIDPCALLTSDEAGQLGASSGSPESSGGARSCTWQVRGGNGVFGIDLRSSQGLKDIVVALGTLSDQRVGSHNGKMLTADGGAGTCMVSIGISDSSRVDVQRLYKADTAKACADATKVAGLIEPRLPKGG
jgi:hypothetical protein